VIYNSISPESKENEFKFLSECKIENFILLAFETSKWTTQARLDVVKDLIKKAESANFVKNNFLIDTCVIDFMSLGLAMSAIFEVKNLYGYPAGTAPHNAVDTWRNLKEKFGNIKKFSTVVSSTIILAAGADFILYGPVQHAEIIFPNVAFIKASQSQLLFDEGKMPSPTNPAFKIG